MEEKWRLLDCTTRATMPPRRKLLFRMRRGSHTEAQPTWKRFFAKMSAHPFSRVPTFSNALFPRYLPAKSFPANEPGCRDGKKYGKTHSVPVWIGEEGRARVHWGRILARVGTGWSMRFPRHDLRCRLILFRFQSARLDKRGRRRGCCVFNLFLFLFFFLFFDTERFSVERDTFNRRSIDMISSRRYSFHLSPWEYSWSKGKQKENEILWEEIQRSCFKN